MNNVLYAEQGKIWKNKYTGDLLGDVVYPAKSESISNFEQVDKSVEETIEVTEV